MPRRVLGLSIVLLALAPARASANGMCSHIHVSNLARELLPPGDLRDLLDDPALTECYRSGSVFPDTGYAADDPYGEMAHWEPFTQAYLEHIREQYGPDFASDEARCQVAYLLGQASHGMADQWFDSLFMPRVERYDGSAEDLDTYGEFWLVVEHDPDALIEGWVDAATMSQVFEERLGYTVAPETFEEGMHTLTMGIGAVYALADLLYDSTWMELPWAATHYHAPAGEGVPGSLPDIAVVVARYWQVIWARLHGTDDLGDSFLASWPADGAVNAEVDAGSPESWVAVAFGHGIDRESLTADAVRLLGPDLAPVASWAGFIYGSDFANVVLVEPGADLEYDADYVVEVGTGVTAMDGRALPAAVSISFHTRCAPDRLADCPPLPDPWVPPEEPPPHPDADADADADLDAEVEGDGDADADADADGGADAEADAEADVDLDAEGGEASGSGCSGGCAAGAGAPGAALARLAGLV